MEATNTYIPFPNVGPFYLTHFFLPAQSEDILSNPGSQHYLSITIECISKSDLFTRVLVLQICGGKNYKYSLVTKASHFDSTSTWSWSNLLARSCI